MAETVAADLKDAQRKHWNTVAGGWGTLLSWTERNFSPLADRLRRSGCWEPGTRVLDVGCGAGFPARDAARSVRPGGTVVATDLSAEMVTVAARAAKAAGLDNVEFAEMDAEHLRFEDASFDAVTNAYGLMFCPDPARAIAEARRVLRPGGRAAFVTWDEPSRNPFFTVILGVGMTFLSLAPPDPAAPGPFRLSSARTLESMLHASGFSDVRVDALPMTFTCESADEYCQIFAEVAWKAKMAALSAEEMARFREAVAAAAAPHSERGRLLLQTTSVCASGRK